MSGGPSVKIVVCGQNHERLDRIKRQLSPVEKMNSSAEMICIHSSDIRSAIYDDITAMVFDTNQLNALVFPFIKEIRSMGYQGNIVMLGHLPRQFDASAIGDYQNLYFLKKPYSNNQLIGLIQNCIRSGEVRQQRDTRYVVRELATLETYSSGFKTETVINDISKSGVRIEGNLSGLQEGDLLRLHLNLDKIKKTRLLSARVIWVKKEGDNKEEAGLEFVTQKDVYQYLLNHAVA